MIFWKLSNTNDVYVKKMILMTTNEKNFLNDQEDRLNHKKSVNIYHGENPDNIVFEGGTTGEEPTTIQDTMNFTEADRGDDGIRTSSPTENTPETEADFVEDRGVAPQESEPEQDLLGSDFLGTNDPGTSGMEGEGMGGHNFGKQVHTASGNDKDNPSRTAGSSNAYFKDDPSEENAGPDSLKE